MNQEKIIEAIAAIIAKNTLGISAQHNKYAQEVAAEIAAAIAPHMEAGAGDDSQYTDNFLKWRKKYFKAQIETTYFVSKHSNERVSNEDLEIRFARAMREEPKK